MSMTAERRITCASASAQITGTSTALGCVYASSETSSKSNACAAVPLINVAVRMSVLRSLPQSRHGPTGSGSSAEISRVTAGVLAPAKPTPTVSATADATRSPSTERSGYPGRSQSEPAMKAVKPAGSRNCSRSGPMCSVCNARVSFPDGILHLPE